MKTFTDEELAAMPLHEAQSSLGNEIYEAAALVERLECVKAKDGGKRIQGNGHHIRQAIAGFASELLEQRWNP